MSIKEHNVTNNHTSRFITAAVIGWLAAITPAIGQPGPAPAPPAFPVDLTGGPALTPGTERRQEQEMAATGRRSVGLAVIYSLLLPGMGELYAGDYGSGKYFTGADGVLWLGLGAVDLHARSMRDDARTFAALHADFNPSGRDDTYYINVGNFDDVYGYNEQALRDRDAYKLYDPASALWRWDATANRELYRDRRVASDAMFNNTRFVVAALAVNRVLSAINAARLVVSGNREGSGGVIDIGARVLGGPIHPHGIALSITRQF